MAETQGGKQDRAVSVAAWLALLFAGLPLLALLSPVIPASRAVPLLLALQPFQGMLLSAVLPLALLAYHCRRTGTARPVFRAGWLSFGATLVLSLLLGAAMGVLPFGETARIPLLNVALALIPVLGVTAGIFGAATARNPYRILSWPAVVAIGLVAARFGGRAIAVRFLLMPPSELFPRSDSPTGLLVSALLGFVVCVLLLLAAQTAATALPTADSEQPGPEPVAVHLLLAWAVWLFSIRDYLDPASELANLPGAAAYLRAWGISPVVGAPLALVAALRNRRRIGLVLECLLAALLFVTAGMLFWGWYAGTRI